MFTRLAGWSGDFVYDEWCENKFTTAEMTNVQVAGKYADPDSDGIFNVFERALGMDPKVETEFCFDHSKSGTNELNIIFSRAENISGMEFNLQYADLLATNWQAVLASEYIQEVNSVGNEMEQVSLGLVMESSNRFFRIQLLENGSEPGT